MGLVCSTVAAIADSSAFDETLVAAAAVLAAHETCLALGVQSVLSDPCVVAACVHVAHPVPALAVVVALACDHRESGEAVSDSGP